MAQPGIYQPRSFHGSQEAEFVSRPVACALERGRKEAEVVSGSESFLELNSFLKFNRGVLRCGTAFAIFVVPETPFFSLLCGSSFSGLPHIGLVPNE